VHALGRGGLEVRGEGPLAGLVAAHLGPALDAPHAPPVWVVVDLVDGPASEPAVVGGDSAVRVSCEASTSKLAPVLAAIRFAAEQRGASLVEGSAVAWGEGGGVVVFRGPSGSGKTGLLLRAVEAGAGVVAAEASWVEADGTVWPLPQPLRVRPEHRTSSLVRPLLTGLERMRLAAGARLPARWSRRVFVDVAVDRLPSAHRARTGTLAGIIDVDERPRQELVEEAERLARRPRPTGGLTS
jgi:hypothetical protein